MKTTIANLISVLMGTSVMVSGQVDEKKIAEMIGIMLATAIINIISRIRRK